MRRLLALFVVLLAATTFISAQGRRDRGRAEPFSLSSAEWCDEGQGWNDRDGRYCEVTEHDLGRTSIVDVDTGGNGGITVRGGGGSTARMRARIVTSARSDAEARDIARDVHLSTSGGRVRVDGPRNLRRGGWSVSIELEVPRNTDLHLATTNGGIVLTDVSGRADFQTTNGGIALEHVGGDVRGRTTNGGIRVALDGNRWNGAGLDVQTTNGGVSLDVPANYNATLSAETTHGGLRIDFPVTVQGQLTRLNRRIDTTLGNGGPRLSVKTVNGGISINRR